MTSDRLTVDTVDLVDLAVGGGVTIRTAAATDLMGLLRNTLDG